MSDQPGPGNDGKPKLTTARIVIWVVGAAIAIYLIASGVIGILTKGQ